MFQILCKSAPYKLKATLQAMTLTPVSERACERHHPRGSGLGAGSFSPRMPAMALASPFVIVRKRGRFDSILASKDECTKRTDAEQASAMLARIVEQQLQKVQQVLQQEKQRERVSRLPGESTLSALFAVGVNSDSFEVYLQNDALTGSIELRDAR